MLNQKFSKMEKVKLNLPTSDKDVDYSLNLSSNINHLIHEQIDKLHVVSTDLLDKDDQNDKECVELLLKEAQQLYRYLQIRVNLIN